MLKKAHLLRLTALAALLVVALSVVTFSLPRNAQQGAIPTLAQLPTEANADTLDSPSSAQPSEDASSENSEAIKLPVQLNREPSATPLTASEANIAAEPTSLPMPTMRPTDAVVVNIAPEIPPALPVLPTAQAFPTLPLLPDPVIPVIDLPEAPVPNQLTITFDAGTSAQERNSYIASLGGTVIQTIDPLNTVVVEVAAQTSTLSLPTSSAVAATEPDYYVSALVAVPPSDPLYGSQWALPVIGAPDGWQALPDNAQQVVVAVIDSGVCADHADLVGRILPGWDYIDNDNVPQDDFGHGCGVAGIIAANADDGVGIAGIAPNALILPLRVLNAQGLGAYSDVAAAIVFAADHNAQIINLSLGGIARSSLLETAIDYALSRGVTVVAAAGNNGGSVLYPAAYAPVIAVGSVDPDLQRSSFSSFGPEIDFLAPGRNIETTAKNGQHTSVSGTSFAAPQVAGVAALEMATGGTLSAVNGIVHMTGSAPAVPTVQPTDEDQPTGDTGGAQGDLPTPDRSGQQGNRLATPLSMFAQSWDANRSQSLALSETFGLEVVGERVNVTVTAETAETAAALQAQVTARGGEVTSSYDRWFDALVPVDVLDDVSLLPGSVLVQPIVRIFPVDGVEQSDTPSPRDISAQVGASLTEGVAASNANNWHTAGITGAGITVAVMDCGFSNVSILQSLGDLPPGNRLTTLGTQLVCDHGSGVAEIVYDMAPGINMILVSPTSATDMANKIKQLADLPAQTRPKIITSSIFYANLEAGDGFGMISSAIAYAVNKGVLYTQAAGNQARFNWQGNFIDTHDSDGWMDFDATNGDEINSFIGTIPAGRVLQIVMRWNAWPTTNQDYDLYLYRLIPNSNPNLPPAVQEVAKSTFDQAGFASSPIEAIVYVTQAEGFYGIAVNKYSASGNHVIDIMGVNLPDLEYRMADRSLVDPATSVATFGVAAIDVNSFTLEPYSSRGPAMGPGGSLAVGNAQPRIAGFANVDTTTYGANFFNGTSAATPHIAGAAALVWQANPAYTVAQVKAFLENRSVDMGAAGYDYIYGRGRLNLGTPPSKPNITTDPQSVMIAPNQTATLTVIAVGTAPLNYQWYQGTSGTTTTPVGTNSPTFTTPALTTTTSYWVRVSNVAGFDNSTTAVVTVDANFNDPIFSNGFESGSLSAWSSNVNDGGDLSVSGAAAGQGANGLQAVIDDTNSIYVQDETPNAEPRYRARFLFDPNSLTMANGDNFTLFSGMQLPSPVAFQLQMRRSGSAYQLRLGAINDAGTWLYSGFVTIPDAMQLVEIDWQRSSAAGANDGSMTLWLDEAQKTQITGIDNDQRQIDRVRLGAVSGVDAGTSGTIYFDSFISRRTTYIGRFLVAPTLVAPTEGQVFASPAAVNLDWNTVAGADQYYAQFTSSNSSGTSGWISATDWSTDVGIGNVTWQVKARRTSDFEDSDWATRHFVVRPTALTSLQGSNTPPATAINLTWTASIHAPNDITGYKVYRNGTLRATINNSSATGYTDNSVAACTTYQYSVRPFVGSVEALDSNLINVMSGCDTLFGDGFESGSLSAWTSNVNDGGDLSVTAGAHLTTSTFGMRALIDDQTEIYVQDDTPSAEPRYRARFYFDPNSITMSNGDNFALFNGIHGPSTAVIQMQIRRSGGAYQIRVGARSDGTVWTYSSYYTISDAPHLMEIDWQAASSAGANNGSLALWIDESLQETVTGLDTDTRRIDRVRLGMVGAADVGTSGAIFFDAFASKRTTYIGPETGGLGVFDEPTETPTVEPTAEITPEATMEPTAEITPEVTPEATVEPTDEPTAEVTPEATVEPTIEPSATPSVEPTLPPVEPTIEPTMLPFSVPVYQTMDDGAPLWTASAGWQLSAEAAYSGLGWQAAASGNAETLAFKVPVNLAGAAAPTLSFQSKLVSGALPEVRVSLDGANWQVVASVTPSLNWALVTVDLSAYAGQTVMVQFAWATPAGTSDTWQVDEVTIAEAAALPPVEPTVAPTEPGVTVTPDAPGSEPPVYIPTPAPREGGATPDAPADLPSAPTG